MELLKCNLTMKSDWLNFLSSVDHILALVTILLVTVCPFPLCSAGGWCSKPPFPGSFASCFLHRFTQWEALGGDRRADGKDWYTSHLLPHSVSTPLQRPWKSHCIVMALHLSTWLNFLHGSSSNLMALVLMPIGPYLGGLLTFWLHLPKPSLGSCGPRLLFIPLILWQLHLLNLRGYPLPLFSLSSLPTLLQLVMP